MATHSGVGSEKKGVLMLRRFLIVGALSFGAAVLVIVWWIFTLPPLCGNEVIQEAVSPDGTRRAVLFQRDCGATTGFTTQISIIESSGELPNEGGNVFVTDGHPDQTRTELVWSDAMSLIIITMARDIASKAESQVDSVTVNYVPR